ncbi:MAG TPA: diaminopimelate epimerase [Streptosporangiaceae bacterium]|nr:diaminopimelate epimerase [Streptosporangiaceae bacterium]
MRFAKGHGTGNDFVVVPDFDDELELTPALVAALCDRHFGVGGDGVLRVVRTRSREPEWFMDYRNADGSVAEMCGNGVRVFVRYLIEEGVARGPEVAVATRAGIRTVRIEPDGRFTVDMGCAAVLGEGSADAGGRLLTGLAISVGNPHLACMVDEPVGELDLCAPRVLSPAGLAGGANIEVVRQTAEHEIEMRVHERGSGLTLSCGTGAVAAAVAAAAAAGEWPEEPSEWTVRVPGGTLAVTPSVTASLLTGPAEIVARGELGADWAARQSAGLGAVAPAR